MAYLLAHQGKGYSPDGTKPEELTAEHIGTKCNSGFGYRTYRRSVDCRIFGVRYVGWYMESSGDYCRLRKAKVQ